MVIGEPQILGQVRAALTTAEAERAVGEELRALLTGALKIGKRVRTETEINRADVSVSGLGVRVAREALGTLQGKTALVIGAGRTSHLSAQLLQAESVSKLIIANRSLASAQALAEQVGGEAITLDDCATAIELADVVFSATAAPATVLTEATVALGRANRAAPLVVVDLAVPADVEAGVGALPGVTLHTLDSLRDMADPDAHDDPAVLSSLRGHERDIAQAYLIIEEGLRDFSREQSLRMAAPGIAALRRHVDLSQEQELARALTQLTHLPDADRAIIERFGARLVDKMFHHLVRRIRTLAEYDEIPPEMTMRVLAQLFAETPDRDSRP
jgi:glutamyl-tRNA reductase